MPRSLGRRRSLEELAGRYTASGIDDLEFARTFSRREPFGSSRARGYRFTGIGTYGQLPGEPDSGGDGSEGICPSGAIFVVEGRAAA